MLKVTILITAYNVARFLERTLESALAQTYANSETIVVDDGSSDETSTLLERYSNRVRIHRLPRNGGVLAATIEGLGIATGDIVCFLDGDDTWEPTKIAEVVERFSTDASCMLVSHDYRTVDQNDFRLTEDDFSQELLKTMSGQDLSDAMRASILRYRGNVWLGSGYSIRAAALRLDEFRRWAMKQPRPDLLYQDHPLATFIVLTAPGKLDYVNKKLLNYRVHGANHSGGVLDDAERGRRIARKAVETHRATEELLRLYAPDLIEEMSVQRLKTSEMELLNSLYAGQIRDAASKYRTAFPSWSLSRRVKESVRFFLAAILGPDAFFWLKRRLARRNVR